MIFGLIILPSMILPTRMRIKFWVTPRCYRAEERGQRGWRFGLEIKSVAEPRFWRLKHPNTTQLGTDPFTVSEIVSEQGGRAVKNSGGLKQIVLDFIGDFAILLVSDSMQQTVSICVKTFFNCIVPAWPCPGVTHLEAFGV